MAAAAPESSSTSTSAAAAAGDDAPEGEGIILLDVDEHLEALLKRPEEAMVLATGLRGGWNRSSTFMTPTPSWRLIPEEPHNLQTQQSIAPMGVMPQTVPEVQGGVQMISATGMPVDSGMDEDEDDSDERYAALYDSVRETCGRIREEERRQAQELEEQTRCALEGYTASKRRHIE